MSYRVKKLLALTNINFNDISKDELKVHFKEMLKARMHGLCFSPYEEEQEPGDTLNEKSN